MANIYHDLIILNSTAVRIAAAIGLFGLSICGLTWLVTMLSFQLRLRNPAGAQVGAEPREPVTVPYFIPFLGSALSFLNEQGLFYDTLRAKVGLSTSMCTVRLGSMKTYIALSAAAVQAVFKNSKYLGSDEFERMVEQNGFAMSKEDVDKLHQKVSGAEGLKSLRKLDRKFPQTEIFDQYLLSAEAVNQLTNKFVEVFRKVLLEDEPRTGAKEWETVNLLEWLKGLMFDASVTAVFGTRLLEVYPAAAEDFWAFESGILAILYGTPRIFAPKIHSALQRLIDAYEKWLDETLAKRNGTIDPNEGEDWESELGSRFVRARQRQYAAADISMKGRASLEVGLTFGLSSNSIPATAWVLFHTLSSPSDVLRRILIELRTAQLPDGSLDIPKLITLPLLQSVYTETLRMYVAFNVTREVKTPFAIDGHLLKAGNAIMAPSWLGHRDPAGWASFAPADDPHPPVDVFYENRFLRRDEAGKTVFSAAGLTGRYFPYGGGAHICPGRTFAKQEIFAAVAMVLLNFDFEFEEWVDPFGKGGEKRFPKVKRGYVGIGVMAADRDMRVRIRRRR